MGYQRWTDLFPHATGRGSSCGWRRRERVESNGDRKYTGLRKGVRDHSIENKAWAFSVKADPAAHVLIDILAEALRGAVQDHMIFILWRS
jgi:hypothetical protein